MQVIQDHIHLFINIPVDISISFSIQQLKGFSAHYTRKRLPNLKKKSLWRHGYLCDSNGHIS
jgi:REP element-mobilizing transposase RayT